MGSSNGTFYNGQPLNGECGLQNGDRLTIGESELIFGIQDRAEVSSIRESPSSTVRVEIVLVPCRGCGIDLALGTATCPSCGEELPLSDQTVEDEVVGVADAAHVEPVESEPIESKPLFERDPAAEQVIPVPPVFTGSSEVVPEVPNLSSIDEAMITPVGGVLRNGKIEVPPVPPVVVRPSVPKAPALASHAAPSPPIAELELDSPGRGLGAGIVGSSSQGPARSRSNPEFHPPAGFWIRAAAVVVDAAWITLVQVLMAFLLPGSIQGIVQVVVGSLLGPGVIIIGWGLYGTTPGKRLFNLWVCTVDGEVGLGLGARGTSLCRVHSEWLALRNRFFDGWPHFRQAWSSRSTRWNLRLPSLVISANRSCRI